MALAILTYAYFDGWKDAERWAYFGDFVGGISGSIFGFANLILLVVISYQLADREDKRNKFPLQHVALMRFTDFMNNLPRPVRLLDEKECKIFREANDKFHPVILELMGLFPGSKRSLLDVSWALYEFGYRVDTYAITDKLGPENQNLIARLLDDYQRNVESVYGRALMSMRAEML